MDACPPGTRQNDAHRGGNRHTDRRAGRRAGTIRPRNRIAPGARPGVASDRRAGAARCARHPVPARGGRGRRPVPVRAGAQRRLARLARRAAERRRAAPGKRRLPGPDADHVRQLPARAGERARARRAGAGRDDRARARRVAARTAADLPGRLRLPRLRPPRRAARPRPLHPFSRRSPDGRGVPVRGLALPAFTVRTAVHARELRDDAAGTRGRPVGDEGAGGQREPRHRRAERQDRRAAGALAGVGGGLRRAEPRAAGARRRGCPQRHAARDAARARPLAGDRQRGTTSRRSGCPRRRRGRQGQRGPRAPVPRPRAAAATPAPECSASPRSSSSGWSASACTRSVSWWRSASSSSWWRRTACRPRRPACSASAARRRGGGMPSCSRSWPCSPGRCGVPTAARTGSPRPAGRRSRCCSARPGCCRGTPSGCCR